jgi:hypothetical protein
MPSGRLSSSSKSVARKLAAVIRWRSHSNFESFDSVMGIFRHLTRRLNDFRIADDPLEMTLASQRRFLICSVLSYLPNSEEQLSRVSS